MSMLKGGELIANEKESIHDLAKEMAAHLYNKVGVYYAESKYEGVIVRARQQFNENSKYLGWHHVIHPEMNHNELVGWTGMETNVLLRYFLIQETFIQGIIKDLKFLKMPLRKNVERPYWFTLKVIHSLRDLFTS